MVEYYLGAMSCVCCRTVGYEKMSEVLLEHVAAVTGIKPHIILKMIDDWYREVVEEKQ